MPRDIAVFPKFIMAATKAALKDIKQIASGAKDYAREGTLTAEIGNWFYSVTVEAANNALSAEDPDDQVTGAIIMILWSIGTSLFTGLVTVGFVLFWSIFLFIGVSRWSDDGDRAWKWLTPDISMPSFGMPSGKFDVRRRDDE